MRALLFLLLPSFFALTAPLPARALELISWRPAGYDYAFLLPLRPGETPAQAWEHYLATMDKDPLMKSFAEPLRQAAGGQARALPLGGEKVLALGMTTTSYPAELHDHVPSPAKMHRLLDPVQVRGAETMLYPAGVTLGLNESERAEFRSLIGQKFDLLLSPGGHDVNPAEYGHLNRHSENVNALLDEDQIGTVRSYLRDSPGFFFGICRGAQVGAVAQGCPLYQHLPDDVGVKVRHGILEGKGPGTHPVRKLGGTTDSPSARVFKGEQEFITSQSIHHQAAQKLPGREGVRVTAVSPADNVVEMMDYLDKHGNVKGMGTQFHPERDAESVKNRVYDVVYKEGARARDRRTGRAPTKIHLPAICERRFEALGLKP